MDRVKCAQHSRGRDDSDKTANGRGWGGEGGFLDANVAAANADESWDARRVFQRQARRTCGEALKMRSCSFARAARA